MFRALSRYAETDLLLAVSESDLPASHLSEIRESFRLVACLGPSPRKQTWPLTRAWPFEHRGLDRLAEYIAPRRYDYQRDPMFARGVEAAMSRVKYDVVVCKGLSLTMKTGISPGFPVILDIDDMEIEWYGSQLNSPESGLLRRLVAASRLAELKPLLAPLYGCFKYKWVVKENDRQYENLQDARVIGVPYYTPDGQPPEAVPFVDGPPVVLLIGSFYHRPNTEGLAWFVKHVWPSVRQTVSGAVFRVVGPGLSDRIKKRLTQPGVEWVGSVPQIASAYRTANCTIAPLWSGAGINVKVFESLAYGRPCVVTPFALKGFEQCLKHGVSIHVAGDAGSFAEGCLRMLRESEYAGGLVKVGRPAVLDRFSFERFASIIKATLLDAVR